MRCLSRYTVLKITLKIRALGFRTFVSLPFRQKIILIFIVSLFVVLKFSPSRFHFDRMGLKFRALQIFVEPLEFGIDKGFFIEVFMSEFVFLDDFFGDKLRFFVVFITESGVVLPNDISNLFGDFFMDFLLL